MRAICLALAGTLLAVPETAAARSWPETAGWTVFEGDDHCGVTMEYEGKGSSELSVGVNVDGGVIALLTNTGWSTSETESYEISWVLGDREYTGTSKGFGKSYEMRKGFGGKFGPEFLDDFAKASSLHVYRGEMLIDQLSLSGSGAATAMARRCLQTIKTRLAAEEKERQRFSHIADDPFAGGPTAEESAKRAGEPPRPLNLSSWGQMSDYPARAMREEREGTAHYLLTVSAAGRVTDCRVTKSSGHADLDAETCAVVLRRARFEPGGVEGQYEGEMKWALPR
ncbi:MAG: energy transducer TonB [Sphingopyxis sp.]|uniref:energy transducer TonB n=1 Tax=Sphingopyxis sp. TaxID=1908224 RepID=UPI002ABB3EE9|nr:energy transducer TonB [Sphingopyxis sp.]MDZ3831343.1 energy transducer TonB [Sphingopyxis sp.]